MGAGALLDEPRIFMDGLSDESGAAAPLAMAIKQLGAPVASEVAQLEAYVHSQLWTPERTFTVSFGRPSVRSRDALDARAWRQASVSAGPRLCSARFDGLLE